MRDFEPNLTAFTPRPPAWVTWLTDLLFSRARPSLALLAVLAALYLAVTGLVYATGGTAFVFVQFMYLPVMLAGLLFGPLAGLALGAVAGVLLGPWMPLEVRAGLAQPTYAWLIRLGFLGLVGSMAGGVSRLLRLRLHFLEALTDHLAGSYGRTLKAFAALLNERDALTAQHSERAARNARRLADQMGCGAPEQETVYWAGILHDLGKIAVPEAILTKPGPLTGEEQRLMQRHVEVGAELLLAASPQFAPIVNLVRAHHERWDGSGYPRGLRGEQIPLGGRILAAVDVFEALTGKRPYRDPLTPGEALAYLEAGAGSEFDPAVVRALRELHERHDLVVLGGSAPLLFGALPAQR